MTTEQFQILREELETIGNRVADLLRNYDMAEELADYTWNQAANAIMPFGKFEGMRLCEISLKYLDGTISEMPDSWIVRRAREVVDVALSKYDLRTVPNLSVVQLMQQNSGT